MPKYFNQHWLPSAYLQFFSLDPEKIRRDSFVYRLGDNGNFSKVKVESQGFNKYHYSQSEAQTIEQLLQKREVRYPELIRKIVNQQPLTMNQKFNLSLIIISWHFRNAAYENKSRFENGIMYQNILFTFLKMVAGLRERKDVGEEEVKQWVKKNLAFEAVAIPNSFAERLLTSDHPFILLCDDSQKFLFAVVPLTPQLLGFVYDTNKIRHISRIATSRDIQSLISLQIFQSKSTLYSSVNLPESSRHVLSNQIRDYRRDQESRGYWSENDWRPEWIYYRENEYGFDCLRVLASY
jgi:Protein of unknown function (DUF4238)